jgi:hypothetical protein
MKNYLKTMLIAAGALAFTPLAASADSIVSQNVTFTASPIAANEIELTITGTPNGNWSTANFLKAFSLKPAGGNLTVLGTSITGSGQAAGATFSISEANQSGNGFCNGNANNSMCFLANSAIAITPFPINLGFDIVFGGTNVDVSNVHLQIAFTVAANSTDKIGDLLSETIVVPGPIVGAGLPGLIFACGGILGLARHRRRNVA